MQLIPNDARGQLKCYCCNKPAKYIMEGTIRYEKCDLTLQVPLCNICALTKVEVERVDSGERFNVFKI